MPDGTPGNASAVDAAAKATDTNGDTKPGVAPASTTVCAVPAATLQPRVTVWPETAAVNVVGASGNEQPTAMG